MKMKNLVCLTVVLFAGSFASATIIEVGTGSNQVGVQIEWADGFIADFEVNFSDASITGEELMFTLESELTNFDLQTTNWGSPEIPNYFVDVISFDGHTDGPYGGDENWWHYWIKDAGQAWASPLYGMSDRVLMPDDTDGWVYGSAAAPVPEPATIALLALGGIFARKYRA